MTDVREQLQKTLSGTYTVERELGGGGMSRVFVARDTSLERPVVVKVLSRGDATKAANYRDFLNLWKNPDPELQPQVAEVRRRLSRLADIEQKR